MHHVPYKEHILQYNSPTRYMHAHACVHSTCIIQRSLLDERPLTDYVACASRLSPILCRSSVRRNILAGLAELSGTIRPPKQTCEPKPSQVSRSRVGFQSLKHIRCAVVTAQQLAAHQPAAQPLLLAKHVLKQQLPAVLSAQSVTRGKPNHQ